MNMTATVLRVNNQSLLVRDDATGQEVLVLFRNSRNFRVGDRVRIAFNGQMTPSIPPQISAQAIQRLGSAPNVQNASEMRAQILQRGTGFLIVQNLQNRQQVRVEYSMAHHFCPRQQVIVRYDTITFSNPPRVTATDILPVC